MSRYSSDAQTVARVQAAVFELAKVRLNVSALQITDPSGVFGDSTKRAVEYVNSISHPEDGAEITDNTLTALKISPVSPGGAATAKVDAAKAAVTKAAKATVAAVTPEAKQAAAVDTVKAAAKVADAATAAAGASPELQNLVSKLGDAVKMLSEAKSQAEAQAALAKVEATGRGMTFSEWMSRPVWEGAPVKNWQAGLGLLALGGFAAWMTYRAGRPESARKTYAMKAWAR